MTDRLIIGNRIIKLASVDSTNAYLQQLIKTTNSVIEGVVVITDNQVSGKGQQGNKWQSKEGENLTFSIFMKPGIAIEHQFLLSKLVSISIAQLLRTFGTKEVKIKWPNDIYVGDKKIAGILIENTLKKGKVYESIIGVGLNVNQTQFSDSLINATSLALSVGKTFILEELLEKLLNFLDKNYLLLKANKVDQISDEYLSQFYRLNEDYDYRIKGKTVKAKIVGVANSGKLQLKFNNAVYEYDMKEVEFLF